MKDFFDEEPVTYALVIRDDYEKLKTLKSYLYENEFNVVYQKHSFNELYITPSGVNIPQKDKND
jgi:hypothetical protein